MRMRRLCKPAELRHYDLCCGLFFLWYWYYGRYPTVIEMWELSSVSAPFLDDIIKAYENGDLMVTSYDQLDRQIDLVLSRYPVSRKLTEMIILRGDRAISPSQKKLSAVKI